MELDDEEELVLEILCRLCKRSPKRIITLTVIRRKIKTIYPEINVRKVLHRLVEKGYVWMHGGRKNTCFGITKKTRKKFT